MIDNHDKVKRIYKNGRFLGVGDNVSDSVAFGPFLGCDYVPYEIFVNATKFHPNQVRCDHTKIIVITIGLIFLILISVLFNSTVVATILRSRSLRKQSGYFKLSLAFAQLLYSGLYLPSVVYNITNYIFFDIRDNLQLPIVRKADEIKRMKEYYLERMKHVGDIDLNVYIGDDNITAATTINIIYMKIFSSLSILTSVVTVLSLFMLSLDSFISIRWPLSYKFGSIMSKKAAVRSVITIWLISFVLSLLPAILDDHFTPALLNPAFIMTYVLKPIPGKESSQAILKYLHFFLFGILVWVLPFVATWVMTVMMGVHSYKLISSLNKSQKRRPSNTSSIKPDMELVKTVVILLTTYTISVLPIALMTIVLSSFPNELYENKSTGAALFFCFIVYSIGFFTNIIVYNFFHKEFRSQLSVLYYDILRSLTICCPFFNSCLPYEKQRIRSSSFISTTISRFRSMRKTSIINIKKSPIKKPNNLQPNTASTVTIENTSRLSTRLSSSNSSKS